MEIGKMKLTQVLPHLRLIAKTYGLKLSNYQDFQSAKMMLAITYCQSTYVF